MIIKRLKSESGLEIRHALYGIVLFITTLVSTYYMATNYKEVNAYCITAFVLLVVAFFTTTNGIKDYKSNKNVHKGSFIHFINSINISHLSLLGEIEKDSRIAQKKGKDGGALGLVIFFLGFVPFAGTAAYWMFSDAHNYYPFVVASINAGLMTLDLMYSGYELNILKVEDEKLRELFEVNDLTDNEKNKLRKSLGSKVDKDGFISRYALYKICNSLKEDQVKRKQKEALGFDFGDSNNPQNDFKEKQKLGELFEKIKSKSGGTRELI